MMKKDWILGGKVVILEEAEKQSDLALDNGLSWLQGCRLLGDIPKNTLQGASICSTRVVRFQS